MFKIYFGTYTNDINGGIIYGEFDEKNGEIKIQGNICADNPAFLCLSEDKKYLYAALEKSDGEICVIDTQSRKIINAVKTNGKHPCHVTCDYNNLFASNYTQGSLTPIKIADDGSLIQSNNSFQHYGSSINPDRQKEPHVHFSKLTPDKSYLAVCDLGTDKIVFYPYDKNFALSSATFEVNVPQGAGPRHLDFSADEKFMYVGAEMGNEALVYENFGDDYRLKQRISTLEDKSATSCVAAVKLSPDGKYLAVSNRGADNIAYYKIRSDGTLEIAGHYPTEKWPRDFAFTPDGKWLVYAAQNDNRVGVYKVNGNSLEKFGSPMQLTAPVCIVIH